jgi:cobalt-zinc-cadmium efflux system outer membrane protein
VHLVAVLILTVLPPRVLTMGEALRLFRENGFDLLLAAAQLAAAEADAQAAAAVANPQLSGSAGRSFGYDPAACPGCSATAWSIGIADPSALFDLLTGKRRLRIDVARAAVQAAQRSRDEALRFLSLQLRQAMLDGALQQAQLDLAHEVADVAERTWALDEKRLHAGAISEAELARAEVAALQAQQAVDLADQASRVAKLQIALLLGSPDPESEFTVDPDLLDRPLPAEAAPADALAREALDRRPDLLAALAQESRAESALALARRQRIPDVALSAQYQQEGSGQSALQPPTVTVGIQLPVPIFYRQAGEIAKAEADLRAQRTSHLKLRAQVLVDVQSARAAVEANRRLVERMRSRMLARARRVRDLVQVQYEKGAASLLELLDAQRTWAQTRSDYFKNLRDLWLSVFQLDAAIGRP